MTALIFLILVVSANVLEGTENVVELCGMDMLDSNDKQQNLSPTEKADREEKLMGDDTQGSMEENNENSKRAVKIGANYWPYDKPVYYSFDDGNKIKNVKEAIEMIKKYTCINFKEVNKNDQEKYHINFKYGESAKSDVGMLKAKGRYFQNLILPEYFRVGVAIHEIMHAFGFTHEQQRPDRDEYIDVHIENIRAGKYESNFKIEKDVDTFGEPYDFNSIMHYGKRFMSKIDKDGKKMNTMTAKKEYGGPDIDIGSKGALTTSDIRRLNRLFKCNVPRKDDLQQALAKIKEKSKSELISESKDKDIKGGPCEEFKKMHQND